MRLAFFYGNVMAVVRRDKRPQLSMWLRQICGHGLSRACHSLVTGLSQASVDAAHVSTYPNKYVKQQTREGMICIIT